MRADNPRDNLPPRMRCGDPLSTGAYLMDQSGDTPSCQPMPSIHETEGARVTGILKSNDAILESSAYWMRKCKEHEGDIDARNAIIHQLLNRLAITGINLPAATTELGPRATIKRGDQFYHVNAGTQKGGS